MRLRKLSPAVEKHQGEQVQNRRKRKHRKRFKNINLNGKEITINNLKCTGIV